MSDTVVDFVPVLTGERFRLKAELPESVTDEDVAKHILK